MKIWKILSPKVISTEERPDKIATETQAKVKVAQVLLSGSELRAYLGSPKPKYPLVPGRFAVGVVAEAGAGCLKAEKNTRVYIHDVSPCGNCEECRRGAEEFCTNATVAGENGEGYLRDFVVTEESNLSPLPPSVSDDEALFIGIVSMCEAVIDRLNVTKGTHVAVIGACEIGNILSQLLIYHQAVPVLIDTDEEKLAVAAQCGVYYTVKADSSMEENITRITGGRWVTGSVYSSYCGLSPDLPFGITAAGGTVVYTGFGFPDVTANLKKALDKRLTLTAVTNDYSGNAAAINLLVNKAVNIAPFALKRHSSAETEAAFAEAAKRMENNERVPCRVIDML